MPSEETSNEPSMHGHPKKICTKNVSTLKSPCVTCIQRKENILKDMEQCQIKINSFTEDDKKVLEFGGRIRKLVKEHELYQAVKEKVQELEKKFDSLTGRLESLAEKIWPEGWKRLPLSYARPSFRQSCNNPFRRCSRRGRARPPVGQERHFQGSIESFAKPPAALRVRRRGRKRQLLWLPAPLP